MNDPESHHLHSGEGDLSIDAARTTRLLVDFIGQELRRAGKSQVVLGLSGGLDSAVSASLAVRALGPRSVTCLLMPYRTSSPGSVRDAQTVVSTLGTRSEKIDITPMVDAFSAVAGEVDRVRLGNVMARARMMLLFDRSAEHDALVLGTSNKSEMLLGYGTLHGDLACALNPLGDLYKTQVRSLAEHLEIPDEIRRKPPSADLWPEQSDEDELDLRYDEVDRLLALLVDARVGRDTAVARGFSRQLVDRVIGMIVGTGFKRRLPLIAEVSPRSSGLDFRDPGD